jgi:Na+/H+ antiporter NhaD/arsenite permease-like protein
MTAPGVPFEFVLFGLTLIGIAIFHHHTLRVSLIGLAAIVTYKLMFTGFDGGRGVPALFAHFSREWVVLCNLLLLLMGFALLADHFESSKLSELLPKYLPHDWKGCFVLLAAVWVLSSFLDNIAGALIGGAAAHRLFRGKVHIGFLAAIVAASNAGGSWSVIGDTTTTMMWIAGVPPSHVFPAIVPSMIALFIFGIPAAIQQQRHSPILKRAHERPEVDWLRVGLVAFILLVVIGTNFFVNVKYPTQINRFPFVGAATWVAIAVVVPARSSNWSLLPRAFRGSIFLLALVSAASLMPVENLPMPSWQTTLGMGFLSAIFDNIPLTALALKQGGYDWAFLAYAVGFGGSMIWFGSSAGVALCNMYPEARSVVQWLRYAGWVVLAYIVCFLGMLIISRWQPDTMPGQPLTQSASFEFGEPKRHGGDAR